MIPLNPYEDIALAGLAPGEKWHEPERVLCEFCGAHLEQDEVFLLHDDAKLCKRCYTDAMLEDGVINEEF